MGERHTLAVQTNRISSSVRSVSMGLSSLNSRQSLEAATLMDGRSCAGGRVFVVRLKARALGNQRRAPLAFSGEAAGNSHARPKRSPTGLIDRAAEMGLHARRLYPLAARLRDLLVSALALAISIPLILVLGLASRRSTKGSALFHQVRVGMDARPFTVQKLRTLRTEAPSDVNKRCAEHLATPMGTLLRKYKLDELPQFWNVLRGDMSLVGPRPIIPQEYPAGEPMLRLAVRPGLTGLWQLSRVREQPFDKNPEYDLFYLANRSAAFDLWLIWRTVLLILTGKETKIRLAARLWERNPAWRQLVPGRARSIPARTGPLRSHAYAGAAALAVSMILVPGILTASSAKDDLVAGQSALVGAREAAARLDSAAASADLERARKVFEIAGAKLASRSTLGLRLMPGLNNNLEVPRTFADIGISLVDAGSRGLEILEALPLEGGKLSAPFINGALDLAPFVAAERPARKLQDEIRDAQRRLDSTPRRFLLPAVAEARSDGLAKLAEARHEAEAAYGMAFLLPRMFGAAGPRNWIIGAENNAELRGRGGYIGSLGTLSTDLGRVELAGFQPTSLLPPLPRDIMLGGTVTPEYFRQYSSLGGTVAWQNLLMSPDFPTGAKTLLANLSSVAGMSGDGLISLDPVALSYLLRATGPVEVPGIPQPLTSDNVVDWSLNKIYFLTEGENDERRELLSVIASTVWSRLLTSPTLDAQELMRAFGRALSERHLVLYSSQPEEQEVIEQLGVGGHLDVTKEDYLLLVAQNIAENKMDYYLTRDINYSGVIHEDGSLNVEARTTVTNSASRDLDFPTYVAGPRSDLGNGRTRSFLSLFVPAEAELLEVRKDGATTNDFENRLESGKRRLGTNVEVGPGESRSISYRYRVPNVLDNGTYRLVVQNQATVEPDTLSVQIQLPEESIVTSQEGFRGTTSLVWDGKLTSDFELSATVETPLSARLLEKIRTTLRQPVSRSADGS
jgi:lipopolysaccharide/colanic/teichoic acid biosynthesis glycosyltransferase